MSLSLNKAVIAGRLTATPELKQTASGVFVTSFTVAVSRKIKHDDVDFINCTAWRQTAEFIAKNFIKGTPICVTGAIQTRKWQDSQGATRSITEIIVDEAEFVESKKEAQSEPQEPQGVQQTVTPNFSVLPSDQDLPF